MVKDKYIYLTYGYCTVYCFLLEIKGCVLSVPNSVRSGVRSQRSDSVTGKDDSAFTLTLDTARFTLLPGVPAAVFPRRITRRSAEARAEFAANRIARPFSLRAPSSRHASRRHTRHPSLQPSRTIASACFCEAGEGLQRNLPIRRSWRRPSGDRTGEAETRPQTAQPSTSTALPTSKHPRAP